MIKFPQTPGSFMQVGTSDVLGNIWSSFNLDLTSNLGRMRVSPRGIVVSNSEDLINMTTPVAFRMFATNATNQKIWAIAGRMFYNDGRPNDAFVQDATSGTPAVGDGSDMELFNNALYVVGTSEIRKYDGSAWTEIDTNIGTTRTTCCVYGGRFYYSKNSSAISSIDLADANSNASGTPNTIPYTLQLSDFGAGGSNANYITSIRASSNRIWIATIDKTSQNYSAGRAGKVFEWDGVSTQANKVYYLDSIGALSMIIKDDIPYIVDADGKLLGFNGNAFVEIARLPVPPGTYLKNPTNTPTQQFIHPRGMAIQNGRIQMLINNVVNDANDSIIENLPSGIWEYDKDIGLYHKSSVSQWRTDSVTRTDYAQNRLAEVGALFSAKSTNDNSGLNGDLLMGVQYSKYVGTELYAIVTNDSKDTISKAGYFVTTKIDSENVEDIWQKVYTIYKKFNDVTDKMVIKYRTTEEPPTEVVAEWTSSTTFRTTTDLSAYAIGDEVEFTEGAGGGQIEHIANIVNAGGFWNVALENPVIGYASLSMARFQKWRKAGTISGQYLQQDQVPIEVTSPWIQLKCVMYFTGKNEVNYLYLINKSDVKPV